MAKNNYDGVIQAVHYNEQGQVLWVRAFLRRGAVWTDHVRLSRDELISKINSGLQFRVGERLPYQGGTFKVSDPVQLVKENCHEVLVSGSRQGESDRLEGVPLI